MPDLHPLKVTGTVEDVFAHRFVLRTADGKMLVDLTPKGAERVALRQGHEVTVEGDRKPSELKVHRITLDGRTTEIDAGKPHGPKHGGPKHDREPGPALESLRQQGYDIIGKPHDKPKHVEILARRDGAYFEVHVEPDGRIRKTKPVQADDGKWAHDIRSAS